MRRDAFAMRDVRVGAEGVVAMDSREQGAIVRCRL